MYAYRELPSSKRDLLTEEYSIDPFSTLPSFFEIICVQNIQENISESLKSTIDVLITKLNGLGSRKGVSWLVKLSEYLKRYRNEVFFLASYFAELASLRSRASACVGESFYGLKRARLDTNNRVHALQQKDTVRLALLMAAMRYLPSTKALQSSTYMQRIARLFPYLSLFLQWRFLTATSLHHSIDTLLMNQVLRRTSQQETAKSKPKANISGDITPIIYTIVTTLVAGWAARAIESYRNAQARPMESTVSANRPWKKTEKLATLQSNNIRIFEPHSD